jgi:hypothetical protein
MALRPYKSAYHVLENLLVDHLEQPRITVTHLLGCFTEATGKGYSKNHVYSGLTHVPFGLGIAPTTPFFSIVVIAFGKIEPDTPKFLILATELIK